jgi:transposase
MEFKIIVGIDMAKDSFEMVVLEEGKKKLQQQVENTPKSIDSLFRKNKIDLAQTLICMEHTGIYNNHLLKFLNDRGARVWLENPVHIKRSLGLVRGKNDKVDANRIAMFAYHHQSEAKLWEPKRDVIEKLKLLMSQRVRLMKAKRMLEMPVRESKGFYSKDQIKTMKDTCKIAVKGICKDIQLVNQRIKEAIKSDERLKDLFSYVTSVPNVGTIVGTAIIVSTNEFKTINNARKFACHCGVAPFEHTSGTSIRGKTRVSHMADKYLKKLLHIAALGSTSRPGELRDYFNRKVEEGKNKMSVLNAIRNKLIHRVFACVRDRKKFIKKDLVIV